MSIRSEMSTPTTRPGAAARAGLASCQPGAAANVEHLVSGTDPVSGAKVPVVRAQLSVIEVGAVRRGHARDPIDDGSTSAVPSSDAPARPSALSVPITTVPAWSARSTTSRSTTSNTALVCRCSLCTAQVSTTAKWGAGDSTVTSTPPRLTEHLALEEVSAQSSSAITPPESRRSRSQSVVTGSV